MQPWDPLRVRVRTERAAAARLDPSLWEALGSGGRIRLVFGSAALEVEAVPGQPGQVELPRSAARRLLLPLPEEGRLLRARCAPGVLHLGPLVGVLTWRRRRWPFGADTSLIAAMTRLAAPEGILVCAFTPAGVDPGRRRITGYLWDPVRERWQRHVLPLPDAVYDRLTSRSVESSRRVRLKLRYLQKVREGRYFNRGFWDKWAVHRALARSPEWASLLPATAPYQGGHQLWQWVQRYGEVWLKPRQGTGGLGILVARREGDGVAVRKARGNGGGLARSPAELHRLVAQLKRPVPYLVQEGLKLARHAGRPFDIRLLVQKDGSGTWRRTKAYARVAGPGALVSNISAGGTGMRLARAFAGARPGLRRRLARIRALLRRVAEGIPRELERALGGPLGEVGLDLAVDESGRLRFIEANAKPFRLPVTLTGSPERVRLSLLRPVQYAAYLAGFMPASDGSRAPCLA